LIGRLAQDNPDWGAPKIHAELQKLGFSLAERTVARYLHHMVQRGDPGQKWLAFLNLPKKISLDLFSAKKALPN